ncbi:hypothetical protein [Sphingomonas sp. RIT328]|uniref:hypothetical protein n=1 Tax=Sphingomonas sp. RIT328 TaxID=1470591 RepID=UPI00044ECB46|nr:hypothetical protein [Sphingomonas sp. RIT328]EZP57235.1 hypothetical protein BW41_00078 [Sphingomonas sp. RIT328]
MPAPAFIAPQHRRVCALAALTLLHAREQGYPSAVEAGKITAADAERGIYLARCIVTQWRWVLNKTKPPCPDFDDHTDLFGAYNSELAVELARAAERQRLIARRKPDDAAAMELADLYEALAWHQQTHAGVAWIVHIVDVERSAAAKALARAA